MHQNAARSQPAREIAVDFGQSLPVALVPLRRLLSALEAADKATVLKVASRHKSAWNRLFPGTFSGVPLLDDVALSPSERRLHRESEQMFQVLNLSAAVICETVRATGRPLVIERAGAADLVSLRAVMRAQEWARLTGEPLPIRFEGLTARSHFSADRFEARRLRFHGELHRRMRVPVPEVVPVDRVNAATAAEQEREGQFLQILVDEAQPLERRLAAAVRAIRACFFTTNYEGAMLAVEYGLRLTEQHKRSLAKGAVAKAWEDFGPEPSTAAIEIELEDIGERPDELLALFHRAEGVVRSYGGENEEALESFARGLALDIGPLQRSHLHMFRALCLIKRLGNLSSAREEGVAGLQALSPVPGERRRLHEAWLRNVVALTWFHEKKLEAALGEELLAIKCVSDQYSASATHLRINLITNLSSLQEAAKKFPEAIATWRKFESMKSAWDTNFFKHHRYRLAALQRLQGDGESAAAAYAEAYESAEKLEDAFHQQVIAWDLGYLALERNQKDEAAGWFTKAATHAATMGDAYHSGEALAGSWLAAGGAGSTSQAISALEADSTWPKESEKLKDALQKGDPALVKKAITSPRTKLNRPFDLVNLY